ncbi:hypothetical protein JW711_01130 [Candidatus Woesearchaeota archaeon]|nr:hypothetical protein [Candidatus Woesearchaeota archaeon]
MDTQLSNVSRVSRVSRRSFTIISVLAIAIMVLFLLPGCIRTGPQYKDVNYFTGSDGLTLDFMNDQDLDEIYENSNFALSLIIENKGAHSISEEEYGILTIGYDPFYISVNQEAKQGGKETLVLGKGSVIMKGFQLEGKSMYYPQGSDYFLHFPYFWTKNVTGQRAKPTTQIFASLCYPYTTVLSEMVCIDYDIYGDNTRSQVCRQQDLSLSDQGAPVAITLVEVENQPIGSNLVRPVFTVHVQNVGRGTVLTPTDTSLGIEKACAVEEMDAKDFNMIGIEAVLSNNIPLECAPNRIRLTDEEGYARCSVGADNIDKILSYKQNYEAPLTINLSYLYMNTLEKEIEVKRINPYGDLASQSTEGCLPFQVESGDGCVNKCDYCAQNPTDASCNPSGLKYEIQWNSNFGCKCSAQTCDRLYPDGFCNPFPNLCPPASYCCTNECKSSEVRLEAYGDACYLKCSTGCRQESKDCACGTEETGYNLLKAGQYCDKSGGIHDDKESCDLDNDALEQQSSDDA